MTNTLIEEYEKYEKIRNGELEIDDPKTLSPTVALPLICNDTEKIDSKFKDEINKKSRHL